MARIARAVAVVMLVIASLCTTGCLHTWTQTYQDYPPSAWESPDPTTRAIRATAESVAGSESSRARLSLDITCAEVVLRSCFNAWRSSATEWYRSAGSFLRQRWTISSTRLASFAWRGGPRDDRRGLVLGMLVAQGIESTGP